MQKGAEQDGGRDKGLRNSTSGIAWDGATRSYSNFDSKKFWIRSNPNLNSKQFKQISGPVTLSKEPLSISQFSFCVYSLVSNPGNIKLILVVLRVTSLCKFNAHNTGHLPHLMTYTVLELWTVYLCCNIDYNLPWTMHQHILQMLAISPVSYSIHISLTFPEIVTSLCG